MESLRRLYRRLERIEHLRRLVEVRVAESGFADLCREHDIGIHLWEVPGVYLQYAEDIVPRCGGYIFEGLCIRDRGVANLSPPEATLSSSPFPRISSGTRRGAR